LKLFTSYFNDHLTHVTVSYILYACYSWMYIQEYIVYIKYYM